MIGDVLDMIVERVTKISENCNFYDLDNFTVMLRLDGLKITLEGCRWDDFSSVAEKDRFREHISITALDMKREEEHEGD